MNQSSDSIVIKEELEDISFYENQNQSLVPVSSNTSLLTIVQESISIKLENYECDVCCESFRQHCQLIDHKHIGQKLFQCEVCHREYAQLAALNIHKQNHVNGPLHRCWMCMKTFSHLHLLQKHVRIHSGEKCEICKTWFKNNKNLKKHMSRAHKM